MSSPPRKVALSARGVQPMLRVPARQCDSVVLPAHAFGRRTTKSRKASAPVLRHFVVLVFRLCDRHDGLISQCDRSAHGRACPVFTVFTPAVQPHDSQSAGARPRRAGCGSGPDGSSAEF